MQSGTRTWIAGIPIVQRATEYILKQGLQMVPLGKLHLWNYVQASHQYDSHQPYKNMLPQVSKSVCDFFLIHEYVLNACPVMDPNSHALRYQASANGLVC